MMMRFKGAVVISLFLMLSAKPALAWQEVKYQHLNPVPEFTLSLGAFGAVAPGTAFNHFILGGWPESATQPRPAPDTSLTVTRGMTQNFDWANVNLLRVDPGNFAWLTNGAATGLHRKLNMGGGPVLVAFDEQVCAIGVQFAQNGAHNPHWPEHRKRTSVHIYDEFGELMHTSDQRPGYYTAHAAFQKEAQDRAAWAVMIESEVECAIIDLIAMPCAFLLG